MILKIVARLEQKENIHKGLFRNIKQMVLKQLKFINIDNSKQSDQLVQLLISNSYKPEYTVNCLQSLLELVYKQSPNSLLQSDKLIVLAYNKLGSHDLQISSLGLEILLRMGIKSELILIEGLANDRKY